jgi:F0F1-type ATP synthase delta subunit
MRVPRRDLAHVIVEATLHEHSATKLAQGIAAYLLLEKRTSELEPLLRDIMQYRLEHGVIEAEVDSVRGLPERIEAELKQLLKDNYPQTKHVTINQRQDEHLVGGMVVHLPNEQLDDSVRGRLNHFKQLIAAEG